MFSKNRSGLEKEKEFKYFFYFFFKNTYKPVIDIDLYLYTSDVSTVDILMSCIMSEIRHIY